MGTIKRYGIAAMATVLVISGSYMAIRHFTLNAAERELVIPETPVATVPLTPPLPPNPAAPTLDNDPAEWSPERPVLVSSVIPIPAEVPETKPTTQSSTTNPVATVAASIPESAVPESPAQTNETLPGPRTLESAPIAPELKPVTPVTPAVPETLATPRVPEAPVAADQTLPLVPLRNEPTDVHPLPADPFADPFFTMGPTATQPIRPSATETTLPTSPVESVGAAPDASDSANEPVAPNPETPEPIAVDPTVTERTTGWTPEAVSKTASTSIETSASTPMDASIPPATPLVESPAEATMDPESPMESVAAPSVNSSAPPALTAPGQFVEQQALAAVEGTAKPGESLYDGIQKPQIILEKILPEEVIVGNTTSIQLVVRNPGDRALQGVVIRDEVPERTRFAGSTPQAQQSGRTGLQWNLGTLEAGEERTIDIQLVPLREGEFGSVATVSFACAAGGRSRAVRPRLAIDITGPNQVLIGESVAMSITVTNEGTGTAKNVFLLEQVPEGLQHVAGDQLENQLGDLRPGESQVVDLSLTAVGVGEVVNPVVVRADGELAAEKTHKIEILAPALDVVASGAKRRFLNRETSYKLAISNPGTADAIGVSFTTVLPAGFEFVSANNEGIYDPQTRTVRWSLEKLPAKETGEVELIVTPTEVGERAMRITGSATNVVAVEKQLPIAVEGVGAFGFEVTDLADPIELTDETVYRITLFNNGSKEVTGIQMTASLSGGAQLVSIEGAVNGQANGSQISFDPIASLMPEVMQQVFVRVRASEAGDQRLRVQVRTDDVSQPVTKEETTRVFAD